MDLVDLGVVAGPRDQLLFARNSNFHVWSNSRHLAGAISNSLCQKIERFPLGRTEQKVGGMATKRCGHLGDTVNNLTRKKDNGRLK